MKEQVARQGDADLKRGQGREPFWVCYLDGWTLSDTLLLSKQTILENSLGRCRWWCKNYLMADNPVNALQRLG